jgi:PAS domain S-box-containing protein/diguanylate cyclase (GGDEF)-like protein
MVLQSLINASPDGVVVCDARASGWPVVYVNHAFEQLTGYQKQDLMGRNLSLLQQSDRQQEGLQHIRAAMRQGVACRTVLLNYRKDGSPFSNELQLVPIKDQRGELSHFASFHRLGSQAISATIGELSTDSSLNTQRMLAHVREDRQTGLLRRSYFEDLLRRDFSLAQREHIPLSIMLFSIDSAAAYRDVFGTAGAELTFKRVAQAIAGCFRRASDLCARWEESQVIAATLSSEPGQAAHLGKLVLGRVRDLAIHHPRAAGSRYLTVSAGIVSSTPEKNDCVEQFIAKATQELGACGVNQLMHATG